MVIDTKKKILLVDDEVFFVKTTKSRLEFEGYNVTVANDGQMALSKVQETKPDIILLDVMMPKMNGYQVCRALRQGNETKDIPIIMLTARAQESDKFWGTEVGTTAYITKPFEMEDLLEKIRLLSC